MLRCFVTYLQFRDPEVKRSICPRCFTILIPGLTSTVRIQRMYGQLDTILHSSHCVVLRPQLVASHTPCYVATIVASSSVERSDHVLRQMWNLLAIILDRSLLLLLSLLLPALFERKMSQTSRVLRTALVLLHVYEHGSLDLIGQSVRSNRQEVILFSHTLIHPILRVLAQHTAFMMHSVLDDGSAFNLLPCITYRSAVTHQQSGL